MSSFFGRSSLNVEAGGLALSKVLKTQSQNSPTSVRIQPAGNLLAAADDLGSLLFFDLTGEADQPIQSRQLLTEYGGISELCWITDDIIAVGTTRGKIITFSSRNRAGRFSHVHDIEAHGDGVSQVPVEGMDVSPSGRCLVSIGEERRSVKLWSVDEEGRLDRRPDREQSPEFAIPRFVKFVNGDSEIAVGYLDPPVVKHFSVNPWRLLRRKALSRSADSDAMSHSNASQGGHFLGSAAFLSKFNQLAVFNLQDGLDLYSFPELSLEKTIRCNVNPKASQGLALIHSGTLLVSPTKEGSISIHANDGTILGSLKCPGMTRPCIRALDACTIANRGEECLVAAGERRNIGTFIYVWRRKINPIATISYGQHQPTSHIQYDSLSRRIILCIAIYFFCQLLHPLITQLSIKTWMEFISSSLIVDWVAERVYRY